MMQNVSVKLEHNGDSIVIPVTVRFYSCRFRLFKHAMKMTTIMRHKELRTRIEDCAQGLGTDILKELVLSFDK